MSGWSNYSAVLQVVIAALLVGAGLPALFALGVRLTAEGAGQVNHDGTVAQKKPVLVAAGWVIFLAVLIAVIVGVLFIARDFIGHQTGWFILGAEPK